jgi:Na+/H+ antiporter NhaD/arsenite permease-like protein
LSYPHILTLTIFLVTYAGVAIGRIPGLRLDRAGIALVGAALMVACGALSLEEAFKAVDLSTLTLLLGMMIIVGQLRLSGVFRAVSAAAVAHAHAPKTLLAAVVLVTGLLSAFLVNDAVCLVMAPLVIEVTRRLGLAPVPYLIGVAVASNAGSVATITGNPQNMIIGLSSQIPYGRFAADLGPIALVSLVLAFGLLLVLHRGDFVRGQAVEEVRLRVRMHGWQAAKAVGVTLCVIAAFFAGAPVAAAALVGGALLLVTRAVKPEKVYREIDGSLLIMFAGLFVVVAGAEKAFVDKELIASVRGLHLDNFWVLSGVTAVLSNLVSNVPAVLVLRPFVAGLPDPQRAWEVIAMASTLAGNFTLLGSVANLIVAEKARGEGIELSFWAYLKVGMPLTLLSLIFGTWWLTGCWL